MKRYHRIKLVFFYWLMTSSFLIADLIRDRETPEVVISKESERSTGVGEDSVNYPQIKNKAPVYFRGEEMVARRDEGTMELYRNVVITQDDLELKADYSIISFLEKERLVKKIHAKGNVEIYQQNNKTGVKSSSYSKEASYNPLNRILTLEGDVKLIKEGNVMESAHIRYDLNSDSVSADQVNGVIKLRNKEKIHDRGK